MGGVVPLGYEVCDRRIVIDEREAATVRYIFRRYQERGCVRLPKEDLDRRGVVSKRRTSKTGTSLAGTRSLEGPFTRSSRIRFTSVRSGTRTSAIRVSIWRLWIERCGSEPSNSFRSTEFAPRATMQATKRVH